MAICWERAVLLAFCLFYLGSPRGHLLGKSCPLGVPFVLFRITSWPSAGKGLSSWRSVLLYLGSPRGHLLGKGCPLGVPFVLFRITSWPYAGKGLSSWRSVCFI